MIFGEDPCELLISSNILGATHGRAPGCPWWWVGDIISNVPSDRQFKRLCSTDRMTQPEGQLRCSHPGASHPCSPAVHRGRTAVPEFHWVCVSPNTTPEGLFVHSHFHAPWDHSISSVSCVVTKLVSSASSILTLLRGSRKTNFPVKLLAKSFKIVRTKTL